MTSRRYKILPESETVAPPHLRESLDSLLDASGILDAVPDAKELIVRLGGSVPAGSPLAEAHANWLPGYLASTDPIPGFSYQEPGASCPAGLTRVAIESVVKRTPGMGSHYGYRGYFTSLLVMLEEGSIWDARGEEAS